MKCCLGKLIFGLFSLASATNLMADHPDSVGRLGYHTRTEPLMIVKTGANVYQPQRQSSDASILDGASNRDTELDPSGRPAIRTASSTDNWQHKQILDIRIDIRETSKMYPKDRSLELELDYGMGDWTSFYPSPKLFAWAAPNIRYQPLYFEDVPLERYGQTRGLYLEPWRSSIHFFTSAFTLPYRTWQDPIYSWDHPLGFCRPGACVPRTTQYLIYGVTRSGPLRKR